MGVETNPRIAWRNPHDYSPIQDRVGVKTSKDLNLPRVTQRVSQAPNPYDPAFLDQREVLRVTYQGDDRCQLACPGCYTGSRLRAGETESDRATGRRKVVDVDDFTGQIEALGDGLQDFFLIGAEPTMDPAGSATKLSWVAARGLPFMSITHGAVSIQRFERTFRQAFENGMYKLNISLDSTDPAVNNTLRGRDYAHRRTLAVIRHCVENDLPIKVQLTVWPLNYPTIVDSVHELYDLGVRGFAFHCGSLEGIDDPDQAGLDHVDPLAWRALARQLYDFRDAHRAELTHFNVPLLYFTETELRQHVIGDEQLTIAYLDHVDRLESGAESAKPFHACPALDVPQVYVFGNDGSDSRGAVSLCQIHVGNPGMAYARYQPGPRRWAVEQDPELNQMQHMISSPHLCPALPGATRRSSDRVVTEVGALYHACRYLGSNQVPIDTPQFGEELYSAACDLYRQIARALVLYPKPGPDGEWPIAKVRRLTEGKVSLAERANVLQGSFEER
ncbi:radical SAM protein [Flindersiella endophytica]